MSTSYFNLLKDTYYKFIDYRLKYNILSMYNKGIFKFKQLFISIYNMKLKTSISNFLLCLTKFLNRVAKQ